MWRYARFRSGETRLPVDIDALWEAVGQIAVPLMLVRGMAAGSVVDDEDEAELLKRLPSARVEHVEGAGHSVQGDRPVELARLIDDFVV